MPQENQRAVIRNQLAEQLRVTTDVQRDTRNTIVQITQPSQTAIDASS